VDLSALALKQNQARFVSVQVHVIYDHCMLVCSFSLLHRSAVLFNFTERSFLPLEDWVCVSFQADNLNSVSAMRVLFSKQLVSVT